MGQSLAIAIGDRAASQLENEDQAMHERLSGKTRIGLSKNTAIEIVNRGRALQCAIASAWRSKRRLGALRGRIARRSCASDKATSRWPARTAASVKVQLTTSRCAWLPPICHKSQRT